MAVVWLDKRIQDIGFFRLEGSWPSPEEKAGHGAYVMTSEGIFVAVFCEPAARLTKGDIRPLWTSDHEREYRDAIRQEIHNWYELREKRLVIHFDPGREELELEAIVPSGPWITNNETNAGSVDSM